MWLCVRILQESTTYWNDYSLEDLKKKKSYLMNAVIISEILFQAPVEFCFL